MKEEKFINDAASGRVLGDEWKGWEGKEGNPDTEASKYLFLGLSLLSLLGILAASFIVWFMISPRVYSLSPFFHSSFKGLLLVCSAAFCLWSCLIFLEIVLQRRISFLSATHKDFLGIYYLSSHTLRRAFRVNRDRFSNSFVKVSNFLIGKPRTGRASKTLVLLPRCLQKEVREKIQAVSKDRKIPVFVVGGGEQARSVLSRERPDSVIAVACERDLVAGIADISKKIAVIGIPNRRPNGPCRDTHIDMGQFEEALKIFVP